MKPLTLGDLDTKLSAKIHHGFSRMEESHTFTRRLLICVIIGQTILNIIFAVKLF